MVTMVAPYTRWIHLGVMIFTIGVMLPGHPTGLSGVEAGRGRRGPNQGPTEEPNPHPDRIQPCQSQDNQSLLNSFLWVLKRDPPSFFFGTIHVPYSRVWSYIPENTKDALYRADNVYFELDLTDPYTISALSGCQLLPHGERLSDVIPRTMYQRLRQHLEYVRLMMPSWVTAEQRARGLYADYLFNAITDNWEHKRPVWVMLMVNSLTKNDIRSRGTPVLDLYLAQEAQRLQKRTGAVEEVDEQCIPLNGLNLSQVLFALNQTLWQHETSRFGTTSSSYDTEDLIRHYNCGDLDTVLFSHDTAQVPNLLNTSLSPTDLQTARQIDGYFREELIYKRNQRMADRIDSLLTEHPNKSFFFAFGAGHFLGNNTVLDGLQSKGHEVVHAAPGQELDLGERYRRRRKKFPPLMADMAPEDSLPPPVINGNLEYMDPYYDRRGRTRHRHGNGGNRRSRQRVKEPVPTDSERLKYPQFNDLWVRLEASSFGPDSVFGNRTEPTLPQSLVYAMYNSCTQCTLSVLPLILLALCLCSRQMLNIGLL